jgi:hypothetical protein
VTTNQPGRCESSGCAVVDVYETCVRISSTITPGVVHLTNEEFAVLRDDMKAGRYDTQDMVSAPNPDGIAARDAQQINEKVYPSEDFA